MECSYDQPADLKMTIGDLLDRQAEQYGDRDALVHVDWDVRYTWGGFPTNATESPGD